MDARPDLLVADVRMAVEGGASMVQQLRDAEPEVLPEEIIVLYPMNHRCGDIELAEQLGVSPVFKPIKRAALSMI